MSCDHEPAGCALQVLTTLQGVVIDNIAVSGSDISYGPLQPRAVLSGSKLHST